MRMIFIMLHQEKKKKKRKRFRKTRTAKNKERHERISSQSLEKSWKCQYDRELTQRYAEETEIIAQTVFTEEAFIERENGGEAGAGRGRVDGERELTVSEVVDIDQADNTKPGDEKPEEHLPAATDGYPQHLRRRRREMRSWEGKGGRVEVGLAVGHIYWPWRWAYVVGLGLSRSTFLIWLDIGQRSRTQTRKFDSDSNVGLGLIQKSTSKRI